MSVENLLIQGDSDYFYAPFYIPYFLVALGLLYILIVFISFARVRYNWLGKILVGISIFTYLLVGAYMMGSGYYSDGYNSDIYIFSGFGFLELNLLAYPYIFLALAVGLGKKGK